MDTFPSYEVLNYDPDNNQRESTLGSDVTFIDDIAIPIASNIVDHSTSCPPQSSMFNDEFCTQLEDLIQKNHELEEKLKQNNNLMEERLKQIKSLQLLVEDLKKKHDADIACLNERNNKLECENSELCGTIKKLQSIGSDSGTQMSELYTLEIEISQKTSEIEKLNAKLQKQQKTREEFIKNVKELSLSIDGVQLEELHSEFCRSNDFLNDDNGFAPVLQLIRNLQHLLDGKEKRIQALTMVSEVFRNKSEKNTQLLLKVDEAIGIFSLFVPESNTSVEDIDSHECKNKVEELQQSELENFARFLLNVKALSDELNLVKSCNITYSKEILNSYAELTRLKELLQQHEKEHERMRNMTSISVQCEEMDADFSTENAWVQTDDSSTEDKAVQSEGTNSFMEEEYLKQIESLLNAEENKTAALREAESNMERLESELLLTKQERDDVLYEINDFHRKMEKVEEYITSLQLHKAMLYKSAYMLEKKGRKIAEQNIIDSLVASRIQNQTLQEGST